MCLTFLVDMTRAAKLLKPGTCAFTVPTNRPEQAEHQFKTQADHLPPLAQGQFSK